MLKLDWKPLKEGKIISEEQLNYIHYCENIDTDIDSFVLFFIYYYCLMCLILLPHVLNEWARSQIVNNIWKETVFLAKLTCPVTP